MITRDQVPNLIDTVVYDNQGEKVGKVAQVYLDHTSEQPSWVTVHTGWFGMKETFVPLQRAKTGSDGLQVAVTKQDVKDAPRIDNDAELPPEREAELYDYYSMSPAGPAAGQRGQRDGYTGDQSGDAMTRSEERMNVSTQQTEQGHARLRKHVVTEHVSQTVPLRHEEVRLEREPITDANRRAAMSGNKIEESDYEVTLHAERPVIETETVPVEQVRLTKETVTEQQKVGGEIRKEKIDFEQDGGDQRRR